MAMELFGLSVDYAQDKASVVFRDPVSQTHVQVNVKLQTPGDQPESHTRELAKTEARDALQAALALL